MNCDVFISYEHNSKKIADKICATLECQGISCFYAPRNVIGDYATSIVNAIESAKVFLIILNGKASNSMHVLNEVEIAYKKILEDNYDTLILPFKIDNEEMSKAMNYYIKRMHWIDASDIDSDDAIKELIEKISLFLSPQKDSLNLKRISNPYFDMNKEEIERLNMQNDLLEKYDKQLYQVANELEKLYVLDVGSGTGEIISRYFINDKRVEKIIGLEINNDAVEYTNKNFGNEDIKFYNVNVESNSFENELQDILQKNNIKKFNVINLSMIILHLKNPQKILMILRKYLDSNGYIFIRDIDDGFNVIYPDKDGLFSKAFEICFQEELSGFRFSGREIPSLLKKCGFKNINIITKGLSSENMNFEEKDKLFRIYFGFLKSDCESILKKYPNNSKMKDYLNFLDLNLSEIYSQFMDENCFFNLGFILLYAKI